MTDRPAAAPLPLVARLLTTTVDPHHPRLHAQVFVELSLRDLVLLHDALVLEQDAFARRQLAAAVEEIEILIQRLGTVLLTEGVR